LTLLVYEPTLDDTGRIKIDEKIEMVHAAFPLQIVKNQGIQRGPDGKEIHMG
jgi:hypothetical protein